MIGAGCAGRGHGLAEVRLDRRDDGGLAGAAVPGFVLDAVPLRGIVRGGDHDAAGSAAFAHAVAQSRGGRDVVGKRNGNAGGRDDFSAGAGKGFGAEAGVVADAEALGGVFLGGTSCGMDVGGDGFGGGADVGKGEVVGDDTAPAVGAELDLGVGHIVGLLVLPKN